MTERYEVKVDNIVQELAKIGFSNIGNYLRKDDEGKVTTAVDLAQCTTDQLAAVESIQYEEDVIVGKDGDDDVTRRKVKFKLHDKKGALVDLLKQLGGQYDAPKGKDDGDDPNTLRIIVEGGLPKPKPTAPAAAPAPAPENPPPPENPPLSDPSITADPAAPENVSSDPVAPPPLNSGA